MNRSEIPSLSEGILLIDKPKNKTAFFLVSLLRKITNIKKIGHAGTLDPLATGVMVLLVGKQYTKLSNTFLNQDKEYRVRIQLGVISDSYDADGKVQTVESHTTPTIEEIQRELTFFQGTILQTPPMYSAKKFQGKKLYEFARKGQEIERKEVEVNVSTTFLSYDFPFLDLHVQCSKGTYIRSIAHDLGQRLGCGGMVLELTRLRSGPFKLENCVDVDTLAANKLEYGKYLYTVRDAKTGPSNLETHAICRS